MNPQRIARIIRTQVREEIGRVSFVRKGTVTEIDGANVRVKGRTMRKLDAYTPAIGDVVAYVPGVAPLCLGKITTP